MPARSTVTRWPLGLTDRCCLFEQRGGLPDPGEAFHAREQAFVEAVAAACAQLQARGADDRVDDFAC